MKELTLAEIKVDIGIAVFAARTKAKMTQARLAKKMGTSQSAIAFIERGSRMPSIHTLHRIAKALGTQLTISL